MTEYICVLLKGIPGSGKYKFVSDIILYDSPWRNLSGLERFKLKWIFLSSNCNQSSESVRLRTLDEITNHIG